MSKIALIVGNVSFDCLNNEILQGGPPHFQIPILLAAGWQVDVLTNATADYSFYSHPKLQIIYNDNSKTTTFEYQEYLNQERELVVTQATPQIQLHSDLRQSYDAIIISGIIGEINLQLLQELSKLSQLLLVDMQSFARIMDETGKIHLVENNNLHEILKYCSIVKGSIIEISKLNEIQFELSKTIADKIIIRTNGKESIECLDHGKLSTIELQPLAGRVYDRGAGDVFLASFTYAYYTTRNCQDSIIFASNVTRTVIANPNQPTIRKFQKIMFEFLGEL